MRQNESEGSSESLSLVTPGAFLLQTLRPFQKQIDALLHVWLEAAVPRNMRSLVSDAIFPGRRMRPGLMLLLRELALQESSGDQKSCELTGMAIELLHRASIIADDMIDGDDMRREQPTFHKKHGQDAAIVISHYLASSAIKLAQSTVLQAELITTYHDMCIGQYADIRSNVRARSALRTYRQFVLRKTNGPFSLAFAAAARYGGQGVHLARALGRRLGTVYQMANDRYDVLLSDEQERGAKRRRILTLSLPIAIAIDAGFLAGETLGTSMDDRAYEAMMQAIRESNVIMKTEQELEKSILATIRMAQEVPCWTQAIDALCKWIRSPVCWDHHEIGNAGY